jgi:hypothetical protein
MLSVKGKREGLMGSEMVLRAGLKGKKESARVLSKNQSLKTSHRISLLSCENFELIYFETYN